MLRLIPGRAVHLVYSVRRRNGRTKSEAAFTRDQPGCVIDKSGPCARPAQAQDLPSQLLLQPITYISSSSSHQLSQRDMFARLAAVALIASSFLSAALAEPIPAPTPAPTPGPVLVERQDLGSLLNSIGEAQCSLSRVSGTEPWLSTSKRWG